MNVLMLTVNIGFLKTPMLTSIFYKKKKKNDVNECVNLNS